MSASAADRKFFSCRQPVEVFSAWFRLSPFSFTGLRTSQSGHCAMHRNISRSPGKARMNDLAVRTYSLASCYENSFTTILRLGSRQQAIQESQVFRNNMRAALKAAMEQAKSLGIQQRDDPIFGLCPGRISGRKRAETAKPHLRGLVAAASAGRALRSPSRRRGLL